MGRRVLRLHIWGYSVCLCPIKRRPGLYGTRLGICFTGLHLSFYLFFHVVLIDSDAVILQHSYHYTLSLHATLQLPQFVFRGGSVHWVHRVELSNTVKPVLSDHIKQDICFGFSDRWLLIAA